MNIKLVRNAMIIMVVIMVISVMGKTSAHEARSSRVTVERSGIAQVVKAYPLP